MTDESIDPRICPWATSSPAMLAYHDQEWGVPSHDERYLFEILTLEGAQAGLSWSTVLNKRVGYRAAFHDWDLQRMAAMTDPELDGLKLDPGIVRHAGKIASVRTNAQATLRLHEAGTSLVDYAWNWVDGERIVHHPRTLGELATTTPLSDAISKDLKKRGFSFVGPTIVYSFLEAVGIVDDHVEGCPSKRG